MERKTLTEWPTELPEGRWEYVFDNSGIYDWTGRFRIGADGDIVFDDADGGVWTCEAFRRGEAFRPVEEDYIAPVRDLAAEAILDADSDPDPRDARIAALEGENAALKASAEANADAVSELAAISALMAADPVLCRHGVLEAFEMLKARADEACGEPSPMRLPSVDEVSARVHEAWMESKRRAGVTSRKLEGGEELMVPYADLSKQAKEMDRATVRAVYAAIGRLRDKETP